MKKNFKRAMAAVMAAALTLSLAGNVAEADAAKKAKLASKSVSVVVGQTKTVKIKNVKAKKVKKLSVKSANKKIATAKKKGKTAVKVTGKKAGKSTKVTVTLKIKGQKKATKLTLKVKVTKKKTPVTPSVNTNAPSVNTNAPTVNTNAPTVNTNAPVVNTDAPAASTKPTKEPGPTKEPTPNPWEGYQPPAPAVENVTLTYNAELKSEENPNGGKVEDCSKFNFRDGAGYPEGGIDIMKYKRVIIRIDATADIQGDGSWYGKVGLTSSDGEATDYTSLGATDDGFHTQDGNETQGSASKIKYLNDIGRKNDMYEVVYNIPENIDQESWSPQEISQYCDAINLQLAEKAEYALLTLREIVFETDAKPQVTTAPNASADPNATTVPGTSTTAPGTSTTAPGTSTTAPGTATTAPGTATTAPGVDTPQVETPTTDTSNVDTSNVDTSTAEEPVGNKLLVLKNDKAVGFPCGQLYDDAQLTNKIGKGIENSDGSLTFYTNGVYNGSGVEFNLNDDGSLLDLDTYSQVKVTVSGTGEKGNILVGLFTDGVRDVDWNGDGEADATTQVGLGEQYPSFGEKKTITINLSDLSIPQDTDKGSACGIKTVRVKYNGNDENTKVSITIHSIELVAKDAE